MQRSPVGVFEHTTREARVAGPDVPTLVGLIESGKPREALLGCLAVPGLPRLIRQVLPWRVRFHATVRRLARWLGSRQVARQVLARRDAIGVEEVLGFYFQPGRLDPDLGHYFRLRFAQPRHLAALALLESIESDTRPVLDIGCGMGHLEHYLTARRRATPAIGVDMNFVQLWIARHWLAPDATYVCANVEDGLPVASDACSAVVCSDAYHYLQDRDLLQKEIRRCAPGRPVLLTRVGNRAVMPNEGREKTVHGYLDEIRELDVRCFSEGDLVRMYLKRQRPLARPRRTPRDLEDAKWLSFVWNVPDLAEPSWSQAEWPHGAGRLGLNPVYALRPVSATEVALRFEFPSAWFAYENHQMLAYHRRTVTVARDRLTPPVGPPGDPAVSGLLESFVLIGLPDRFRGAG